MERLLTGTVSINIKVGPSCTCWVMLEKTLASASESNSVVWLRLISRRFVVYRRWISTTNSSAWHRSSLWSGSVWVGTTKFMFIYCLLNHSRYLRGWLVCTDCNSPDMTSLSVDSSEEEECLESPESLASTSRKGFSAKGMANYCDFGKIHLSNIRTYC